MHPMAEVTVYAAPFCLYCIGAKTLLKRRGIPYREVRISMFEDGARDRLQAELDDYLALKPEARIGRGWLVNYHGRPVQDVDRAWDTMLGKLELPMGREWRSYVLRHSIATLCRNRGAERWDLEGFMGHRAGSQTEVYAIGEFPSVQRALQSILDDIETLAPGSLHRKRTGAISPAALRGEVKMSG